MYPTLGLSGDYILHSPLFHRFRPLPRGALVTAISPGDPSHQVLKRVIGLEGDTICVDPSGERGLRRRAGAGGEEGTGGGVWEGREWVTIPKGHVWLAGDNASNSTDSRDYGPVPLGLVKGRVLARVSRRTSSLSRRRMACWGDSC